ncbi:hypothetical protein [Myxococcus landrumensis]|uniref:Uncharacterized protein n=1 Tax=Myxococcus landrumensis TaxID=2813577 RepID=A0ABX7NFB1_9BACT|nr:hypothetical protein [Myxococcus landrumus]QSQ14978.1 hypothetical protein JY572_02525 [Myxococcus landrumus]
MHSSFLQFLVKTHPWGIAVLFVLWFALIARALSWVSGWHGLARQFRADGPAPSDLRNFTSGKIGWLDYKNCLAVGGDAQGLYLVPNLVFRLFHPPLRIPWSELHDRELSSFFFVKLDTFRAGESSTRIQLRAAVTEPFDFYMPPAN